MAEQATSSATDPNIRKSSSARGGLASAYRTYTDMAASTDWQYDPKLKTEIDSLHSRRKNATRLELEETEGEWPSVRDVCQPRGGRGRSSGFSMEFTKMMRR